MERNDQTTKSWLQRLKDESWEAELLISAVAIYGIFQSFDLLDYFINYFITHLSESQYLVGYGISFMGLLALSILAAMFIIHFVMRSYWIGLVGLNSVFPDYSLKDSAYSPIYTEKMVKWLPKLTDSIDAIDDLCSVIFSAAFTLLGIYTSIAVFSSLYLFLYNALQDVMPAIILLVPVGVFALLLVAQMVVYIVANMKRFKTNAKLQNLYFNVAKIGSLATYGPMTKNFLQVAMIFGSNFKKKRSMVYLVLAFFLFGAALSFVKAFDSNLFFMVKPESVFEANKPSPHYYQKNNLEKSLLLTPEIDAELIEKNGLKLFIPIFESEVRDYKKKCNIAKRPLFDADRVKRKQIAQDLLVCYQNNHAVHLNGKAINVDFMKYEHPITKQFGLLGFVDLTGIGHGQAQLKVVKRRGDNSTKAWEIPFYLAKHL